MDKSKRKAGLAPGSVIFTGHRKVESILTHYLQYDVNALHQEFFEEQSTAIFRPLDEEKVDWYDIRGIHDASFIEAIGNFYQIHPLILEDIADVHQRPKFEEYERGIFISARALSFDKAASKVATEQVAIYFRKGLILSFQETDSDLFSSVRKRLEAANGKIRQRGADYLAYALLDTIVDHYFILLEDIEEAIEKLEEQLLDNPSTESKSKVHLLKKELLLLRKSISPLREAVNRFVRAESSFIEESSLFFVRDLYDHTIQIMDMVENHRDMLIGLQELYVSEMSFKMNQVMQLLTLISVIFIPLTFLAGIYGMNFDHMPELHGEYSYFILLAVMLVIFIGLLLVFKRKKWI